MKPVRRSLSVLLAVAVLLAAGGYVVEAQVTGKAPVVKGRFVATGSGTAPVLSSCGTATVAGTDTAGRITFTAGNASCIVTFNEAFGTAPSCTASNETTASAYMTKANASTTAVTFTFAASTGNADTVTYICIGR